MKSDITLSELMHQMEQAIQDKAQSERARVNAEFKRRRSQNEYTRLQDVLRNKEYSI